MVHILLNIFGVLIFAFVPGVNRLPLLLSRGLSRVILRYQHAPLILVVYVAALFFGLHLAMIMLLGL